MKTKLPHCIPCWMRNACMIIFCIGLTLHLSAQVAIKQKQNACEHLQLNSFFRWNEVHKFLAEELTITPTEAAYFVKYLRTTHQLGYRDDIISEQLHSGKLLEADALSYWMGKATVYAQLYKELHETKPFQEFTALQKALNREPLMYTGGADCNNLDFSNGTTNGWKGTWNGTGQQDPTNNWYGLNSTIGLNSAPGFNNVNYVHQLCTSGMDRNVPINRVPPNHTYSLRLGNDSASYSASGAYNHQTISNTFTVTSQNNLLVYWYAVVFDQLQGTPHVATDQPFFKIRMFAGNKEINCAHYDVNCTSAATIGGFKNQQPYSAYSPNFAYEAYYKDWTPVMIPLLDYIGQQVTITFETSDCNAVRHFGYAYLTTDCAPFNVIVSTPFPCGGGTATLTAPLGAATYLWTGPGIVGPKDKASITINSAGHYSVTMTTLGSQGANCSFTLDTTITASGSSPFASFTTSNACLGVPTTFTNTSLGSPVSWNWTFGDGQSDKISKNPVHTYTSPGTYKAMLFTTNAAGCTDSTSRIITVYPNPQCAFTSVVVCQGTETVFTNNSSIASPDNIASYDWDFGDKSNATDVSPQHTYTACGDYTVKLTAVSNHNCSSSITQTVSVICKPEIDFTVNNNTCLSLPTVFNSTASPIPSKWEWNFGDGTTDAVNLQPAHVYNKSGTYVVTFIASMNGGCADTAIHTITIYPNPVAGFTANRSCEGDTTVFNSSKSAVDAPDHIIFYNWTFGDNEHVVGPNPGHLYDHCGTYFVNLIVVSNHNCTGTFSDTVKVNCKPAADFSASAVCVGDTIVLKDLSTFTDGVINSWCWDLDKNPATCELPNLPGPLNYAASTAGALPVTLTVTSSTNCKSAATHLINIYPRPVASYLASAVCAGATTVFTDQSTIKTGVISKWNWSFGNSGLPGTTVSSPAVVFPSPGTHLVQLNVTSDHGCTHDTAMAVTVYPNPVPLISVDDPDGCPLHHANFTGSVKPGSVTQANSITKWEWDMDGDGKLDYSHVYTPGSDTDKADYNYDNTDHFLPIHYHIKLAVTTNKGCMGSTITADDFITVYPEPVAEFSSVSSEIPGQFIFTDQSIGANSYFWNFGDLFNNDPSQNTSVNQNPSHVYKDESTYAYMVKQWVTNKYGCRDSISHPVEIIPIWTFYIPNAFTPNGDWHNEGFRGKGINIHSYNLWIFDRWGNAIFYSNNLEESWNGVVQGQGSGEVVQQDVYVWRVKFKDVFNKSHEQMGTVTVVK